jgi:16S rRNA (cytosine1402-N4)-methyltransferase
VLLAEVVQALEPAPGRRIIDATFGAGGYSLALLEAGAHVAALDRDPGAAPFAEAAAKAFPDRFRFLAGRFSDLESLLDRDAEAKKGAPMGWNGIVFDLGVSSMQLDQAERGFSFMRDGPLDMRMDRSGPTAADLVNETDEEELARILWIYGEERASRRVARAIVRRRAEQAFTATLDLAAVVERALGGRRGAPTHPATRTFQALRLVVNEELAELEAGLDAAERVLGEGGRLAVVTFHSLEDRLVKSFLTERSGRTPQVSRHRPPAEDARRASFTLLFNGARAPGAAEVAVNPRSRSAKLRAGVRTDAPAWRRAA